MITTQELRIGNWVYDDNITLAKVIGFKPFDWSVRCDEEEGCELLLDLYRTHYGIRKGMMCESTKCEPIPITPEILEKCGFEFDTITFSKIYFLLAEGDNGFDIWIGGLSKVKLNPIKYVHELQNLFYAITKEELTFKP